MYQAIHTLKELHNYLSGAATVAFDFETAPDEKYRTASRPSWNLGMA
jgi:hypothetical protein